MLTATKSTSFQNPWYIFTMEKLKSLFIIFLLLIFISLVLGAGVAFMSFEYAAIVAGTSLVISSLAILALFVYEFKPASQSGVKS